MSQRDTILAHLKRGRALTAASAMTLCGCYRLAARIQELRDCGYSITSERVQAGSKHFARYKMTARSA